MAEYSVLFVRSARKEFEQLPKRIRGRVVNALKLLAHDPHSELLRIKKLKGADDLFRIRLGEYRLVYQVDGRQLVVITIKIGHRSEIYRR